MPRLNRVLYDGVPYHVTQRGNHRQAVFTSDFDRAYLLERLGESCLKYGVAVLGYCLMPNHVHFILQPESGRALSKALASAFHSHAMFINRIRRTVGHLWQERFYSGPLDDSCIWAALRYVEVNPVPTLVSAPDEWQWSSARAHLGLGDSFGIVDMTAWRSEFDIDRWRQWLTLPDMAEIAYVERLKDAIRQI